MGDIVLDLKNVAERLIEPIGPDMATVLCVNELCVDTNHVLTWFRAMESLRAAGIAAGR